MLQFKTVCAVLKLNHEKQLRQCHQKTRQTATEVMGCNLRGLRRYTNTTETVTMQMLVNQHLQILQVHICKNAVLK
mgnify:FL=1